MVNVNYLHPNCNSRDSLYHPLTFYFDWFGGHPLSVFFALEICHLRFILWPLSRLFQLAHTRIHWKIKRNMTFLCILWEKRGKKTTVYIHVVDYLGARVNMYMRMGVTSRALYRRRYLWTCCHFSNWDSRLTYNVTDFEFEKNNRHPF